MSEQDKIQRSILPIPDQPHVGLTTYDAKDPDTKYPPIRELRPPKGAPNTVSSGTTTVALSTRTPDRYTSPKADDQIEPAAKGDNNETHTQTNPLGRRGELIKDDEATMRMALARQ